MEAKDLWNQPIGAYIGKAKRKPTEPNGYPAIPGYGPEGETCRTCKHICRIQYAKTYIKCGLAKHRWTGGPGTDIRAKSPACKLWEKNEE